MLNMLWSGEGNLKANAGSQQVNLAITKLCNKHAVCADTAQIDESPTCAEIDSRQACSSLHAAVIAVSATAVDASAVVWTVI